MAECWKCSGEMGHGCLCKNRGAHFSVQCEHFKSKESYKDFSCENAIDEYKEKHDKEDLEKANEGMKFINLGEDNEKQDLSDI